MVDNYACFIPSPSIPPRNAGAVTPNDTTPLTDVAVKMWIGVGGNLAVQMAQGQNVTLVNVGNGTMLDFQIGAVFATGTTCTDILAFW